MADPMIIVSDAHVSAQQGNPDAFFRMLRRLEDCVEDIVFLGDIFDLWIALPRYEDELHRRFLRWCERERRRRSIGFVEGNHEYFVTHRRKRFFSWSAEGVHLQAGNRTLFCHGDQINRKDVQYLRFRKLAKNRIVRWMLLALPPGPRVVALLKVKLKATNPEFRKEIPREEIAAFAEAAFRRGVRQIFTGHFHRDYRYCNDQGRCLHALPGWCIDGRISRYEPSTGTVRYLNWDSLGR